MTNVLAAGSMWGPADDRRRMLALLRREAGAFTGIAENRDAIIESVDVDGSNESDRFVFEGEMDAIERIAHVIAAVRASYTSLCDTI